MALREIDSMRVDGKWIAAEADGGEPVEGQYVRIDFRTQEDSGGRGREGWVENRVGR
jgi:hypothetical protein